MGAFNMKGGRNVKIFQSVGIIILFLGAEAVRNDGPATQVSLSL